MVLIRPDGVDPTGSPGLWVLVGPTALNWITNAIPEASTQTVERLEGEHYVGEVAAWLGLDVHTRTAYGDLDVDQMETIVLTAVAHFLSLS